MKEAAREGEGENIISILRLTQQGRGVRAERQELAHSEDWQQGTDGQEEKGNITRMGSYAKISKGSAGSADELRDTGIINLPTTQSSKDQKFW